MAKGKTLFECSSCGYRAPKWLGQCPGCNNWETMLEQAAKESHAHKHVLNAQQLSTYGEIAPERLKRFSSGSSELDRVLGGGFVPGSLLLVGGDPGIGKSTLMLKVAANLQNSGKAVLYVSGEESLAQIKLRGERLGIKADDLCLMAETSYEAVEQVILGGGFDLIFVDSIQTLQSGALSSAAGSVAQVREVAGRLMGLAKTRAMTVVMVGHITKDGLIAGPKTLEHMVDGVFYFEGDKYHYLRLIRAQKNRFGPAQELGIFRMESKGLVEVPNPSQLLLEQRPHSSAGSVVVPCVEGTRPLLVEIQVLLSTSTYASPRRIAMGVDANRLALIMAVMEKKAGLQLQGLDVFVNVVGGLTIEEPAVDLGLALALYSSFRNIAFDTQLAVFGELGLAGEIRAVSHQAMRLKECNSMGFKRVVGPRSKPDDLPKGLELAQVATLVEALERVL